MGLHYSNLDEARHHSLAELDRDRANGTLYVSSRLNDRGKEAWPGLLREAIRSHDDDWLAARLRTGGFLNTVELQRTRGGRVAPRRVPFTAAEGLAEGEFNRFQIRGLCAYAMATGIPFVEVYRGKIPMHPRPESENLVGAFMSAEVLLADLRVSQGVDTALGVPAGPNSGLTVRLPPLP